VCLCKTVRVRDRERESEKNTRAMSGEEAVHVCMSCRSRT